jgi:hypothetical protein
MVKLGIMLQKAIIYCSSVLWACQEKALRVCSRWDGKVPTHMRTMLLPKAVPVSQTPFMSDFVPLQRTYKGAFGIQRMVKFLPPRQLRSVDISWCAHNTITTFFVCLKALRKNLKTSVSVPNCNSKLERKTPSEYDAVLISILQRSIYFQSRGC